MIAHVSVPARNPKDTALFLGKIIDGAVFEFPVVPGAWIAVAEDGSGLAIEVYPIDMAHHPGVGDVDPAVRPDGNGTVPWEDQIHPATVQTQPSGFHLALSTTLREDDIVATAKAAGWRALPCDRAGVFKVVEVWIDNNVLVEVLVPKEVERYRAFMNRDGCSRMFGPAIQART